ncbi:hypothetical protein PMAYCL1PPCAC_10893, partial [Pristionchus mayeri]
VSRFRSCSASCKWPPSPPRSIDSDYGQSSQDHQSARLWAAKWVRMASAAPSPLAVRCQSPRRRSCPRECDSGR